MFWKKLGRVMIFFGNKLQDYMCLNHVSTGYQSKGKKAAGLGVVRVARDYTGSILGVATRFARAMALMASTVMIESDARAIVQNVNSANAPPTDVEVVVLQDCIELMNLFQLCKVDYVCRKCKEPFLLWFPPCGPLI